jgi:hypothetical protein
MFLEEDNISLSKFWGFTYSRKEIIIIIILQTDVKLECPCFTVILVNEMKWKTHDGGVQILQRTHFRD